MLIERVEIGVATPRNHWARLVATQNRDVAYRRMAPIPSSWWQWQADPPPTCSFLGAWLEATDTFDATDVATGARSRGWRMKLHLRAWQSPAQIVVRMPEQPLAAGTGAAPLPNLHTVEYDSSQHKSKEHRSANLIAKRNPCVWIGASVDDGGHCEAHPGVEQLGLANCRAQCTGREPLDIGNLFLSFSGDDTAWPVPAALSSTASSSSSHHLRRDTTAMSTTLGRHKPASDATSTVPATTLGRPKPADAAAADALSGAEVQMVQVKWRPSGSTADAISTEAAAATAVETGPVSDVDGTMPVHDEEASEADGAASASASKVTQATITRDESLLVLRLAQGDTEESLFAPVVAKLEFTADVLPDRPPRIVGCVSYAPPPPPVPPSPPPPDVPPPCPPPPRAPPPSPSPPPPSPAPAPPPPPPRPPPPTPPTRPPPKPPYVFQFVKRTPRPPPPAPDAPPASAPGDDDAHHRSSSSRADDDDDGDSDGGSTQHRQHSKSSSSSSSSQLPTLLTWGGVLLWAAVCAIGLGSRAGQLRVEAAEASHHPGGGRHTKLPVVDDDDDDDDDDVEQAVAPNGGDDEMRMPDHAGLPETSDGPGDAVAVTCDVAPDASAEAATEAPAPPPAKRKGRGRGRGRGDASGRGGARKEAKPQRTRAATAAPAVAPAVVVPALPASATIGKLSLLPQPPAKPSLLPPPPSRPKVHVRRYCTSELT